MPAVLTYFQAAGQAIDQMQSSSLLIRAWVTLSGLLTHFYCFLLLWIVAPTGNTHQLNFWWTFIFDAANVHI